ncbi:prosaposin [Amblyraja radiata]|uniref:prosaposin n=1 Tax=Amblyraja radiata TaxID=386614 RepID=UPI001402A23E|nr:prosaposin [Amblyraja radiata]
MAVLVTALLLLCVSVGAAVAKPFSGQQQCAKGPPFWCHDVKTASECGAVKHCQQNVWRQPTVKSVPCDLCKEVMSVVGNLLKDNTTEAEVRSYLNKACELLPDPTTKAECNELIDDYLPIILDILNEELENPEVVCSALHLCQTLQEALNRKDIISNEIPEVDLSKSVSPFIANVPLLLYPEQTVMPKSTDDACRDCNQFITNIQLAMKVNDGFLNEFISQLKKQCNVGAGLTELCEKYIVLHGPQVAEVLTQRSAEEICAVNGFCQQAASMPMLLLQKPIVQTVKKEPVEETESQGCVMCEFAMKEISTLLQKNTTEEAITEALIKVCSILPATVKSECQDFVDQYGKAVIELLSQEMDPEFVCTMIGLCKKPKRVAADISRPKQQQAGALCEVCETMVRYLDDLLEKNSTEVKILAALEKVCSMLPDTMRDECDQLVSQYEPVLLQVLLDNLEPTLVCTNIGVCDGSRKSLLGAEKCVWGPSYWCANMDTATQCNAVEHCKRHIWN